MFPQPQPELMIISTIHSKPCKYTPGDHYNFMSIVNKQVRLPEFSTCWPHESLLILSQPGTSLSDLSEDGILASCAICINSG